MDDKIKTAAEAEEQAALPQAYASHLSPDEELAEQQALPAGVVQKPVDQKSAAEWAYERIVLYIQNFEKQLDQNHEVAMGFVGGDVGSLRIMGMGFFAPDILTFYGAAPDGSKMQLVQHVSQLNVTLVAAPKENDDAEPARIGFQLAQELDQKAKA